ncbi:MAG: flagellar motor protein [Gammaproteobacteria bacterium]|nr:flagellar motor protein [Gammaproteobacteria bacterium]
MDILSIFGLILAISAIIFGNLLGGGETVQLFQLTAFLIVVGGTMGAVMIQTSFSIFLRAMSMGRWVFFTPSFNLDQTVEKLVSWSQMSRREGLLALEDISYEEEELFTRKALQLLVDGNEPETIRQVMETEISIMEHTEIQAAKVYEAMGGYSPTIGIIGAVMGLIHVMNNLADPSRLGDGIATAFVATIYGVGLANLVLLPMAGKLKSLVHKQIIQYEMLLEGIVSIADGENPRSLESKLQSYLR